MSKRLAYAYRVLGFVAAPKPADEQKACLKATRRRFRELRDATMPAETLALGLLKRRCAVCPRDCWGPGR
jgi:hypothetical protein